MNNHCVTSQVVSLQNGPDSVIGTGHCERSTRFTLFLIIPLFGLTQDLVYSVSQARKLKVKSFPINTIVLNYLRANWHPATLMERS